MKGSNMEIIDTHVHLLNGKQFAYDWAKSIDALKSQDFCLQQYSKIAESAGITNAIFMETAVNAEYSEQETIYAKTLENDEKTIIKAVIAGCFPEKSDGFNKWLEQTSDARYAGYRRILHTEPDGLSQSNIFVENIKKIGDQNKCFDMCFLQRQLPLAVKLAKTCENTQFILDHCGVPDIENGEFMDWATNITKLAELENVVCKISGLLAYFPSSKNALQIVKPYFEHCIQAFGWDRVVWGGDWPVINMTSTLPEWVTVTNKLLSKEDQSNQEKLFSKNAITIYNLG